MVQEFQPNFQPGLGEIRPMKKHENRGYAIIPSKVHYQPITFTSVGKKKKSPITSLRGSRQTIHGKHRILHAKLLRKKHR
jgi:hypothetical protein